MHSDVIQMMVDGEGGEGRERKVKREDGVGGRRRGNEGVMLLLCHAVLQQVYG